MLGWKEVCYPIILHGDGGVYTKNNASTILTISLKSLLSRSFAGNVIPCFCIPKHIRCIFFSGQPLYLKTKWLLKKLFLSQRCFAREEMSEMEDQLPTADEMWCALIHMLNACYEGKHNTHNHLQEPLGGHWAGLQLCDGQVRLIVWVVQGDLEFLGNELKYPHFNSTDPCSCCPASRRY